MSVLYLDHDPKAAATGLCDFYLRQAAFVAAAVLSGVWDANHSSFRGHIDHPPKHAELLTWFVPPARGNEMFRATPSPDPLYALRPGDRAFWMLAGQRINVPPLKHPLTDWAGASVGNYRWVLDYGTEAIVEHQRRFGSLPPGATMLWPLECVSPAVPEGPLAEPVPAVPEEFLVTDGGFYDAVASYRRFVVQRTLEATWTKAKRPTWWKETL